MGLIKQQQKTTTSSKHLCEWMSTNQTTSVCVLSFSSICYLYAYASSHCCFYCQCKE